MKHGKTYSFISRFVILFFVVVLFAWGSWLWWKDSIAAADDTDSTPVNFVVASGEGVKTIASNLASQHIIRSPTGFYVLVKMLGIERRLQAGEFRLNRSMDAKTIALELTHGISDLWITAPEGLRSEEIATKIAKELDIPEAEFLKYAKEGYMFPDTYLVPRDATAAAVVKIFTDTFDKKFTTRMRADAAKSGLTVNQIVILASLVEKEGKTDIDRPMIAAILLNRLKMSMPLQVDATLQYALGYQPNGKTWWKKELTDADKKIKSPYNTYENPGLPPGPICNPGQKSLESVIYAKPTDYVFYLHDESGNIHPAKTLEEHEANIRNFLQ